MVDLGIESLDGRVVGETQDVAATNAGQPAGAGDEQEAQGAHAPDQIRIGAFAGAGFRGGQGVELEAPDEVVGEDAELLPGTVGPVVTGGDDVESELPFELRDGFLLRPAAADEGIQGRQIQGKVRGDGAVLVVAIVGVNRSSWKFRGVGAGSLRSVASEGSPVWGKWHGDVGFP